MTTHFTNVPTVNYDDSVQLRQRERSFTLTSSSLGTTVAFPSMVMDGPGLFNIIAAGTAVASFVTTVRSAKWDGTRLTPRQTQRNLLLARNGTAMQNINGVTTLASVVTDAFALQAYKEARAGDDVGQGMANMGLTLLGVAAVSAVGGLVATAVRRRDLRQKEHALK